MDDRITRRSFLKAVGIISVVPAMRVMGASDNDGKSRPNIILCMADDLGYGDTGYNGHAILKTPNLDEMARGGIRFDRFYAAAPVCSPTRGSAITGRHPYRYGIFYANVGHMKDEEFTLAEALKGQGYATGHFGKWHLGTLSTTVKDANRGSEKGKKHYSGPWENGFDECFSTESKVPTYDPMIKPAGKVSNKFWNPVKDGGKTAAYNTRYWSGPGKIVTENLKGDDSRVIMDRAIPFIEKAAKTDKPFLAVIWFHTPHWPVVAGDRHRAMYAGQSEFAQNYYGCITAMDEQVGRLRKTLRGLDVADNTMLFFCSDNGPEGKTGVDIGSAGSLRGRKRSLYEGGIRVPGLLEWPSKVKTAKTVDSPVCTSDYLPTVLDAVGFKIPEAPKPTDGISMMGIIEGKQTERPTPIAFESQKQLAFIDNRYKLYSKDAGETYELYDIINDESETKDLAAEKPETVTDMKAKLDMWRASCKNSVKGNDYNKQ